MEGIILFYGSGIVIGIAVSAHMETGIIRSNVISHKTGARLSKRLFLRDRKCGMKCFLVGSLCHAAAAVGAISSQFLSLPRMGKPSFHGQPRSGSYFSQDINGPP